MEVLRSFDGRRIVITPGMVELGEEEESQNEEFGREIACSADFAILVGKKRAIPIRRGILSPGISPGEHLCGIQSGSGHPGTGPFERPRRRCPV